MQSVRIFFEKTGGAKYISHLDLMRCFSRAIKRADIDICYTEGYNPHPFMTFSLPLSLGIESYCESVDIKTNDDMPFDEIERRLKDALPDGINVTSVAAPVNKADKIEFAEFDIIFTFENPGKASGEINDILSSDEILAEKKAKKGREKVVKQINIKKNIKSFSIDVLNGRLLLNTVLTAGVKENINPSLLIECIEKSIKSEAESTDIIKRKMLLSDMTEFK